MKFVAKKEFLNVPALGLTLTEKTPGFLNENHIPLGHRFSIGSADVFKQCTESERKVITALISSESVIVDTAAHAADIAKIDALAKTNAARRAGAAKFATP
jgi:hypothetical protein